ncbi:MAG: hypothetical protein ACK5XM_07890 [Betaproteobacteria bacterium]
MTLGIQLAAAAIALATAFGAGWQINGWRLEAGEKDRVEKAIQAREAGLERVAGVSAAYQQLAAELRRLDAVNRVETIRETNRVEYRCQLPADGQRLLDAAVNAANSAAAGGPPGPVRADRHPPGG